MPKKLQQKLSLLHSILFGLLMAGTTVPKQWFFNSAKVWQQWHCWKSFFFGGNVVLRLMSASTSVPKRSYSTMTTFDNFWALLNLIFFTAAIVFFGAVDGVLQCRYKGCSLVPIFDDYWHCWKWFSFLAAMLYFGTVEVQQRRKEFYSTMPTFDNFAALLNNFLFFSALLMASNSAN